jgi:hypothetical protein
MFLDIQVFPATYLVIVAWSNSSILVIQITILGSTYHNSRFIFSNNYRLDAQIDEERINFISNTSSLSRLSLAETKEACHKPAPHP